MDIFVNISFGSNTLFFSLNVPVYNVAGLCSYDLFDEINFEEWFSQSLVKELQNKSPKYVEECFVL